MYINFIMSSYVESPIFNDIFDYFQKYSQFKCIKTLKAIDEANVYYYFRPHLETKLKDNSIVTVHHDLNDNCSHLDFNIFLARYKEAKLVICLNSVQQQLLFKYGIKNTIIIPHGYNHQILSMNKKTLDKKIVLGFFSNYYPRLVKGEDYFLELARSIAIDKFEFVLVGKKRKELFNNLIELGFNCKLFENIKYSDFDNLYKKIDCLLITSKFEGGPASVPESLATCTPILSTNVGMIQDLPRSKGVKILTGDTLVDVQTIYSLDKNLKFMKEDICLNIKKSLKTWEDIVVSYDIEFMKYSIISINRVFDIKIRYYHFNYWLIMRIKDSYKFIKK